jgi:hypothetical protein
MTAKLLREESGEGSSGLVGKTSSCVEFLGENGLNFVLLLFTVVTSRVPFVFGVVMDREHFSFF